MMATVLLRFGAFAAFAVIQACDVEGSLGYWKAGRAPSAARNEYSAARDEAGVARDRDASVSSGSAGAPVPRAGDGAAGSGGSVGLPGSTPTTTADACQTARAGTPALEVTIADTNAKLYDFAAGAQFPAGNYRVAYVDGCRKFDGTGAWTLHASAAAAVLAPTRRGGAYLIMSGSEVLGPAPGTAGVLVGPGAEPSGAFATYEECVAANRA